MQSTKPYSTAPKSSENNSSYIEGLSKTWAFRQNLSDWNILFKLLIIISMLITAVFYSLFFILKTLCWFIIELCKWNKIAKYVVIITLIICSFALIDYILNYGKVYPGVYIGDIDLGGKTIEETNSIINENFSYRLSGNNVVIYVDEAAREAGESENAGSGLNEQLSIEEARQTVRYWKTNSIELEAELPVAELANMAVNSTRGILNIPKRIGALLFKLNIKPYANYSKSAIDAQINKINDTIGKQVINPTCKIEDGIAYAVSGEDGSLVNTKEFEDQLNTAFFQLDSSNSNFIPKLYHANQNISYRSAELLADKINSSLDKNVNFEYKGNSWNADKLNMSSWININVENREYEESSGCACSIFAKNNYCITANVDSNKAGADILSHTKDQNITISDYSIKFEKSLNNVSVKTNGDFEMPSIYDAVDKLNSLWLENAVVYEDERRNSPKESNNNNLINISITSTNIPELLSLKEALTIGVVSEISTYTTTFSSGAGAENRNQNIALGADLLNNSICEANGGRWSFNQTTGDTNAEAGFLEAGAIVGNRYTKSIGGGICQVATTVFNAVYEGGFQVISRHNHNLHMESYPAGRDAAVSYPDLDLIWQNNEASDVLMTTSHTGYSVTCTLLGVNQKYSVKTEVGQWEPGDHYETENVIDNSKKENSKFTQTSGSDGKSIIIKREVYDRLGNLVLSDEFKSVYIPKTEIIVYGPGEEANKLLAEGHARMKNEADEW